MVLACISVVLALQQPQNPPAQPAGQGIQLPAAKPAAASTKPDVGGQDQIVLTITKHIQAHFDPSKVPKQGSWSGAMQEDDISEGQVEWSVENSTYQDQPCKLFKAFSKFEYHPNVRNKRVVFTPALYEFAQITPAGKLLHTSTSYAGLGQPVTIDATYNSDSIDITKTEGRQVTQMTLYPKFSMDLFNNLFDPLIKDGLIVAQHRQLAFLNPITAAPTVIDATLNGRFEGELYFRQYEGYKLQTTSPDVAFLTTSLISRHGQLLQVNLPDNQDAIAYTDVGAVEEKAWGKFKDSDWDIPASVSQPNRQRYQTLGIPVLITQPSYLIVPLPFAVAVKGD